MIAASANRRIFDFVQDPLNHRLRPGTGSYSTPFRGCLFELTEDRAISERLAERSAAVLWLGANPCVPVSLDNILSPPPDADGLAPSAGVMSR